MAAEAWMDGQVPDIREASRRRSAIRRSLLDAARSRSSAGLRGPLLRPPNEVPR